MGYAYDCMRLSVVLEFFFFQIRTGLHKSTVSPAVCVPTGGSGLTLTQGFNLKDVAPLMGQGHEMCLPCAFHSSKERSCCSWVLFKAELIVLKRRQSSANSLVWDWENFSQESCNPLVSHVTDSHMLVEFLIGIFFIGFGLGQRLLITITSWCYAS